MLVACFILLVYSAGYVSGQCSQSSCVNGVCSSDGSDTCLCDTNWFGTDCNTSACDYGTGPCLNGGTCHRGQGSNFTCDCMTGYGGTLCQSNIGYTPITLCNSTITKDCNNQQEKGTCVIDYYSQNATCICADGISGDSCDTIDNHCLFFKCLNGGTCVPLTNQPAKFKCICPPGYDPLAQCRELYRRYNVCETHTPCENGGKCIIPSPFDINGTYYTCQCPPGFTGQNCSDSFDYCSGSPCQNNGTCSELPDHSGYQCTCPLYYTGDQCQTAIDPCQSTSCFNGGTCVSNHTLSNDTYIYSARCLCPQGFHGDQCQLDVDECLIDGDLCQNNGTCVNQFGGHLCLCPQGITGDSCETNIDECHPNSCQNGGRCIDGLNSFECDCTATAFVGHFCEFPQNQTCLESHCYNGGECEYNQALGRHSCRCPASFKGELCHEYRDCVAAGCNGVGTTHCSYTDTLTCYCKPGYAGPSCVNDTLIGPCMGNACGTGSTCQPINETDYRCLCSPGRAGPHCEYSLCARSCSNGGTCLTYLDREVCLCPQGWGGESCSLDLNECVTSPCSNGGTCTNTLGGYKCACLANFTGKNCDVISGSCDTTVCQNGGTCFMNGQVPACNCTEGYQGALCDREICKHSNCSQLANNGECDLHCFSASCNYDGGRDRCYISSNDTNPWRECSISSCRSNYSNGICDLECNNAPCLYDGNDCLVEYPPCPSENATICSQLVNNGICDPQCNTLQCHIDGADCSGQVYLPGTLILRLVAPANVLFESHIDNFKSDLERVINAIVSVVSYEQLMFDQLTYSEVEIYRSNRGGVKFWYVILQINIQYCIQNCPTSVDQVLNIIDAAYSNGRAVEIGEFSITGAATGENLPEDHPFPIEVVAFLVTVAISVVLVLVVVVILGKRIRDNGGIKETVKKLRVRSTWRVPGGNTPEPDTPSQIRETSFDPERPYNSSERIVPESERKNVTTISWQPLKVTSSNGATCILGERGTDSRKWTRLHMEAAYQPVDRLIEMLPQFPLEEINAQGPGGFTPLMIAIISEDKEINRRHKLRATPVRSDSSSGSEPSEQEMLLISRSPKFLHPLNTGGDIGHMYHHHHSRSLISAFAAVRADVNITNDYGQSALHLAAKHGRDDLISQLLCVKADPNLPDKWGQTPLHVSIGAATDRAFKALLDYHPKTSIDMRSQGGITPLMMAVKMANQSILQQLLTKGAEIAATDNEGRTVIHWAAMVNNVDALSVLTKHGPDNIKDAPNGRGETALFLACREGNYDAVKFLLFECYANSTLLDSLDRSPLHISYEKQHGDIVELLQQANQNSGIQPLAVYNHQKLSGAVHNPMYSRANGIKIEPEMHHPMLPPTYQQSTINPSYLPYPTITSSNNHQITESSIYRVSSIEAELERLVSSAMSYTNYSGHLPLHVSATTIQPTNAEVRPPEGVSPKGYSPGSSHSPALAYPTQSLEGSSQPLSHLPYESSYPTSSAGPFLQTPSSSTISSIEPNHPPPRHYNTALQPISHTSIPGGHSPPIGQTVSPNSVHNGARHPGFSPPMVPVTSDNQSPLSAYQCFPSPPKEAGEYPPFTKTSNTNGSYQADIINSLTPSPEDYSYQQSTENSPPQQQAILQGHYAYEYAPQSGHDIHPTQLPLFSVSYNARHESTV